MFVFDVFVVCLVDKDGVLMVGDLVGVVMFVVVLCLCVVVNMVVGYNNFDMVVFNVVNVFGINMFDVLNELIVDFGWVLMMVVVCWIVEFEYWLCVGYW